jgi:2-phosphosulfolactate phosphatase
VTAPIDLAWGPTGAAALDAETVVVVDVLSFTTTTTVAVERGLAVLPFGWHDDRAAAYAEERGAVLAVGRLEARERPGLPSLSPAAMASVVAEPGTRVVLPSPNGSTISALLAERGGTVVAACLRNAEAVARAVAGRDVAVVACGERWPDGTLRPAVEDLWGAGAVLSRLAADHELSPDARAAVAAYDAMRPGDLHACPSGRELVDAGFRTDVDVAAEVGVSRVVPVLGEGGWFRDGCQL